jgi:hypothetical protein
MYGLAGHLAMHFVIAAFYSPYFSSRHEVFPVVELAHNVLHAIREHGHLMRPEFQLVHSMARDSRVCIERIVNLSEVKMIRQNRELVMT